MEQCPVCEHPVRTYDRNCNQCGAELTIPKKVLKVDQLEVQRLTKLADDYVRNQNRK